METSTASDDASRVGQMFDELEQTIRELPPVQRTILRLLLVGYSMTDIARILDLPVHKVCWHTQKFKMDRLPVPDVTPEAWSRLWGEPTTAAAVEAFRSGWESNASSIEDVPLGEIAEIASEAGRRAAAAARWHQRIGETLETSEVTKLLAISRQALDSRKRTGSVLALPDAGTSRYPSWQFDLDGANAAVRPITLRIVTAFRKASDELSPYTIASWAMSPQPELEGRSPADWIVAGRDDEHVIQAAQRAAHLETL